MSNLLNITLRNSLNALKTNAFRLPQKSGRAFLVGTTRLKQTDCFSGFFKQRTTTKPSAAQQLCTRAYEVDTNVAKDIILFKYDNPKYYRMLNIFAICQFVFWSYLSHFAFTTLKDAPVEAQPSEELSWYQKINLGENKYRNGISIFCFLIGYGVLFAAWMFTLRSVRYLILRKGGKEVSLVTYGPFGQNRIMNVPIKCVSAQESRAAARVHLPLKVQNKSFFYVLDMRGEFRNPGLFDYTAGLKRGF